MLDIYSVVELQQCILESLYPHLTTNPPPQGGGAPSRPSVMPALLVSPTTNDEIPPFSLPIRVWLARVEAG